MEGSIFLSPIFLIAICIGAVVISVASVFDRPFDRFKQARNRIFARLTRKNEGKWQEPFFFMQLADTQLGMLTGNGNIEEEEELCRLAVKHINRLKPKFAIVCGDLIHAFPEDDVHVAQKQVDSFKNIFEMVDPAIPLVCLCGNHDVGNKPTADTIQRYTDRFGDDYLTFWVGGVKCIVVNASLYKDGSGCRELAQAHDEWLKQTLEAIPEEEPQHVLVFSHIPPMIYDFYEEDDYFNLDADVRHDLLRNMRDRGVRGWFCGHFHRNAQGWVPSHEQEKEYHLKQHQEVYGEVVQDIKQSPLRRRLSRRGATSVRIDRSLSGVAGVRDNPDYKRMEVVTTSAVGCQITTLDKPLGLPVELSGLGTDISGFRIVKVQEHDISHQWFTFDEIPDTVDVNTLTF